MPVLSRQSTSVIPTLIDALIAGFKTAVPGVQVFDGFGLTDDPGDSVTVGADDPDAITGHAATSRQTFALAAGRSRDEEGEVTCAATSKNGDGDPKRARDSAFAMTNAIENWLRGADLGLPTLLWVGYGSETNYIQDQDNTGAFATVIFRIAFKARI